MSTPVLRFPRPLRLGDRIGVTSPSAGVAGDGATRIEFCVEWLRERGYDVEVGECMDGTGTCGRGPRGWTSRRSRPTTRT